MQTLKKGNTVFIIGLLLVLQLGVYAQEDTTQVKLKSIPRSERTLSTIPDKAYFKSWLTDARDIAISPYRWNKGQWIAASAITVMAVAMYTQDAGIEKAVQKAQNPFLNEAAKYGFERLGSGFYSIPALGIMYGIGAITKNDKARYTSLKAFEAYLMGFVASQVLKQLTQRHRPYQDDPPNSKIWDGPFTLKFNSSFPSGHSTVAFAMASVIATAYSKTIWVPIMVYTFAGLTAASRVYQNDHWFSDVFVGSAIGFAIGRTIMNNHIKKLKVLPISHTGMGVMLIYQL